MSLPVERWDPDSFKILEQLLLRVSTQPTTSSLRRLLEGIEDVSPWLLSLTQMPSPSEADKQETEKHAIISPHGPSYPVTGDLLSHTQTISAITSLSYKLSAYIGYHAQQRAHEYISRTIPEIAVYLLETWTTSMLDFLHELLRLTIGPQAEAGEAFVVLSDKVVDLLQRKTSLGEGGRVEGSLVDLLLSQTEVLQSRLDTMARPSHRMVGAEYDLYEYRIQSIRSHQEKLVSILATVALSGYIGRGHIVRLVKILRKTDKLDSIVAGLYACFCSLVTPVENIVPTDPRYETATERCRDLKFLKVVQNLINAEDWTIKKLRDAVKLPWSLYIHSAVQADHAIGSSDLGPWAVDQYPLEAISGGSFETLTQIAPNNRQTVDRESRAGADALARLAETSLSPNRDFVLLQLQSIIQSVTSKKALIRALKHREEDVAVRKSQLVPTQPHFSALLALVTAVYSSLPFDAGQHMWKNYLIDLVLDNQDVRPSPAAWKLLDAITRGPQSAQCADERLMEHKYSFDSLFVFYRQQLERMPRLYEDLKSTTRPKEYRQIPPLDIQRFLLWTPVLANVVRHSPIVRSRLLQRKPHPIQVLFEIINSEIDVEVKAVVFDAITAFCASANEDDDVLIKTADYYEKITYPDSKADPRSAEKSALPVGWLNRVDVAEQDARTYPLTRAHLTFLTALLSARLWEALRVPYRAVDQVFNQLAVFRERKFVRESEQWELLDDVLAFLEKALVRFTVENLVVPHGQKIHDVAWDLYDYPGFKVLLRILADREQQVFDILSTVVDNVPSMNRTATQNHTLLRVLRIFHRVLETQLIFTDVLLLSLDHAPTKRFVFRRPADMKPLDYRLLNHLDSVIAVALLIKDQDVEIAFLAVKIVSALAASPIFNEADRFRGDYTKNINRLAGIIDASDDSIRIAQAYCIRLDQSENMVDVSPEDAAKVERDCLTGRSAPTDLRSLPYLIRSNILDLLIAGTSADCSPNIAHFLLGFEFKGHDFSLQDPDSPSSRYSCLQIIMDQLRDGDADINLVTAYPVLAAKTARILYQLFSTPLTSQPTMAYASVFHNFSSNQLDVLPLSCPVSYGPGRGVVQSSRGVIETTADTLIAYLDFQRHILTCVALETHENQGRTAAASAIAMNMFGQDLDTGGDPVIIEVLANIELAWHEDVPNASSLEYFASFDFDSFKLSGADWFDLESLEKALRLDQFRYEKSGRGHGARAEADYLLHRLAIRNRETKINMAKGALLTAWAEMLKVALGRLFVQQIPEEQQEGLLFSLLNAIFARIESDISPGVLEILSESILITTNTLQSILFDNDGVNLPVDQLGDVFSHIISAIVRPGTTENARGNLYASMSQYLSLLSSRPTSGSATDNDTEPNYDLQRICLSVIGQKRDRFFAVLSRDALDVRDVWKTQCYALLTALVEMCATDRDRQVLLPLWKDGHLSLLIRGIKDREISVQECLMEDAVDVHAFWVFEAKMAFLLSVSATRKGAEDLLDAGIFETLSMCSFISVQPYVEDSVGRMERQHRVLLCVLQLLSQVMSSLHTSTRSPAAPAIAFLGAHHDSILFLLRESQQSPSLVGVEESQLIVGMLAMVVHQVVEGDRRSSSSLFGATHLAVLSLAARFFDLQWADDLEPEAKRSLQQAVLGLNHTILTYLCAYTTGLKAGGGVPVLVNGNNPGGHTPDAPTLFTSIGYLAELVDQIESLSADYDHFSDSLREGGQILSEDLERLDRLSWADNVFSGYDVRLRASATVQSWFSMVESLLLLSWRHLLFYASDAKNTAVRPDSLSLSLSYSTMAASRSSDLSIRSLTTSAAELRGVLERLTHLVVPAELRVTGGREDACFGMLVRRLAELTGGLTGDSA